MSLPSRAHWRRRGIIGLLTFDSRSVPFWVVAEADLHLRMQRLCVLFLLFMAHIPAPIFLPVGELGAFPEPRLHRAPFSTILLGRHGIKAT